MAKKQAASKSVKKSAKSAKKSAAKAKAAPKAAKPASKRAPKRAPAKALSTEQRRKLLKMRDQSGDVIETALRAWTETAAMRVPGLTPAKLRSRLAAVKRAADREATLRAKMEAKLRPLVDARMTAEDAAYRGLLDLNAAVKLYARNAPELEARFAFLAEHLRGQREEKVAAEVPAASA